MRPGFLPADFSQCGVSVVYGYSASRDSDPVTQFSGSLADVGGWAAAEQEANKWVAELEAKAKNARIGKGAAPKF